MKCDKYGITPGEDLTPIKVRDAIVECFISAHAHALEELKEYADFESDEEFEKMKRMDVRLLIKKMFAESGGDFNNPDKESLIEVIRRLESFAANFRDQKVIKRHKDQIMELVNTL